MIRLSLISALVGAGPTMADDYDARRASCTPILTTVSEACEIATHSKCLDGHFFTETLEADGAVSVSLDTVDGMVVYDLNPIDGIGLEEVLDVRDAFSIQTLLSSGQEKMDVTVRQSYSGLSQISRLTGQTQLTGKVVEINGHRFKTVQFQESMELGFGGNTAVGVSTGLIEETHGIAIAQSGTVTFAGAEVDFPGDIVFAAGPDEPGFMTRTPYPFCEDQLS